MEGLHFKENDWRNRNRIKTANGPLWLTISVRRASLTQKICETRTDGTRWRKKHWDSFGQWYAMAPYLKAFRADFEELYLGNEEENLSAINHTFINAICGFLDIRTKISRSGDYHLSGNSSERLLSLCQQVGATAYLSGPAAKSYLNVALFEDAGIEVVWMDYSGYPEYRQLYTPPFVHEVSIIDLMLNEGPDNAKNCMLSFQSRQGQEQVAQG